MLRVTVLCFLASYLLAFGLEWTRFVSRSAIGRWLTLGVGIAGFIAQTMYLLLRSQQTHLPPLLSSMQDWLLVLAWLMVLIHLFVALTDRELALGFVFWPVSIAFIVAAQFSSPTVSAVVNVNRNWTMLHVALLVVGIAGVTTGFIVSLLFLFQHRRMKQRIATSAGFQLPSLERLARINRWILLASIPALTFGMVIGIGLTLAKTSPDVMERLWSDPVVIASSLCWVLMIGMFIWLIAGKRTTGRQVAWFTAWACGFLLLTTVGAQILAETMSSQAVHGMRTLPASAAEQEVQP